MIANDPSFRNKVMYGIGIVVLLIPLYIISRPAVRGQDGTTGGGILSSLRRDHDLSQAKLGEIDPASETMKLATLGMRGVAANILWHKATEYKKRHDWDNLTATLNQISKLQPNFISVWQFQGWNLAYNVSVEFDDYRSRYHWVKRGVNFLRDGLRYNTKEPVLHWELGWTFGHKIGKADEYIQFRRLYSEDEDFHRQLGTDINMDNTLGPNGRSEREQPDNWLTGRQWFLSGQEIVDGGIPIRGRLVDDGTNRVRRGKTPLLFHSHPSKWLISHAVAIEEEGVLDEKAQVAWMRAGDAWYEYGNRAIPTSYGFSIRLNDEQRMQDEIDRIAEQIDAALPGVREEIENEKRATLSVEEIEALELPPEERTQGQMELAFAAERRTRARYAEIAERAPEDQKREIQRLIMLGELAQAEADAIFNYREQVNYPYWKLRTEVEQTDTAIKARRLIFEADKAFDNGDLETMRKSYEEAWKLWSEIFEKHPVLMEDTTAEELMDAVRKYAWLLNQQDEAFPPKDFPLLRLLEHQSLEEEDL